MKPCSAKEGKYTRVQGGLERMEAFSSPQNGIVSVRAELRQHCGDTRQRMRRARLCHSLQAVDGSRLVRERRGSNQGPAIHTKAVKKMPHVRSRHSDRRWPARGARTHIEVRRRLCVKKKDGGKWENSEGRNGLYTWTKRREARGTPRYPMGRR